MFSKKAAKKLASVPPMVPEMDYAFKNNRQYREEYCEKWFNFYNYVAKKACMELEYARYEVKAIITGSAAVKRLDNTVTLLGKNFEVPDYDLVILCKDRNRFMVFLMDLARFFKIHGVEIEIAPNLGMYERVIGKDLLVINLKPKFHPDAPTFSTIQNPHADCANDVTCTFDMNICKVAYDIMTGQVTVSPEVIEAIRNRTAVVDKEFHFKGIVPTPEETKLFAATLLRMEKYRARGFVFASPP